MTGLALRLIGALGQELRTLLEPGPRTNAAMCSALSGTISLLIALWLHLDNPWWAAITGFVILQQNAGATFSRSIDRAVGTIAGALIGYVATASISDHFLFALICASSAAFAIYGQERVEHGYAVLLFGVTIILVMFGTLAHPTMALHLAVYRALEILVGIAVACVIASTLQDPVTVTQAASAKPGIWSRPIDRDLIVVAISGGIAIALIPMIWEGLQLPGLEQTPITAFVILTTMRHEPAWKAITRACGCLLGALYGLVAMSVIGDAFLPWLTALAAGLFVCGHIYRGGGDVSYVGLQAGVAIIIAMIQGPAANSDILPAIDRLVGIFGGILVVAICHPVLVPIVRRLIGAAPKIA
jgi:uncharacterized membrane protein YccC